MDLQSELRGEVTVITLSGTLDALTALSLSQKLKESSSQQLVVDLTSARYISSAGIQTLLQGIKNARANSGDLRAVGARGDVRKILELSGVSNLIKFFPNVETAVASYEKKEDSAG